MDDVPVGAPAEERSDLLWLSAQEEPYQRRCAGRARAALAFVGEEGEEDGGDGGDGVVAGVAAGSGHAEGESVGGAQGVGGEAGAVDCVRGGGGE